MQYLFANNPVTTLASPITNSATALSVVSGAGALFPNPGVGQGYAATIIKAGNPLVYEIVLVLLRVGDSFSTIVRGQEGTAAQAWNAGDTVAALPTAAGINSLLSLATSQAQGTNYAADVGAANAYRVNLTPALTAHVVGMPIRFLAANSNTGTSTFHDGVGSASLVYPGGANLPADSVVAGSIYTVIWNGSTFILEAGSLVTGTFTATLSGVSGTVNFTMNYSLTRGQVTLWSNASPTGTSTGTNMGILNIPALLQPSAQREAFCSATDNSIACPALAAINGSSITLYRQVVSSGVVNFSATGWNNSSQPKGLDTAFQVTYPL